MKLFFFFFKTQHTHTQRKNEKKTRVQKTDDDDEGQTCFDALSRLLSSPPPGAPRSKEKERFARMHRVVVFDRENNHSNVVVCHGTLLLTRTTRTTSPSLAREHQTRHTKNGIQQRKQFTKTIDTWGLSLKMNVDRAMRRLKRTMINEKMFDAFKERLGTGDAGFRNQEKRVLALKERDRLFKKTETEDRMDFAETRARVLRCRIDNTRQSER